MRFNSPIISLHFKGYHFRPSWSITLGMFGLLALFIGLGSWQLERAREKAALQQTYESRLQQSPRSLNQLPNDTQDLRYYPVEITGHYDNAHHILVDNKVHQRQVGYDVITPFIPDDGKQLILINRGWIAAGKSRNELPVIAQVIGTQTVRGIIYIPIGKPFLLSQQQEFTGQWPVRVQVPDISLIAHHLQQPLYPFLVLLDPTAQNGFVRDWKPVNMPAQKHIGYAVQWFTFALVLIIIFLALNIRSSRSRPASSK